MSDLETKLETIVDSATLFDVVEALQGLCFLKAEHLSSNWQDDKSARTWTKAGLAFDAILARQAIRAI